MWQCLLNFDNDIGLVPSVDRDWQERYSACHMLTLSVAVPERIVKRSPSPWAGYDFPKRTSYGMVSAICRLL